MQTLAVLFVVLVLGAIGGAISRLLSTSSTPEAGQQSGTRFTGSVRLRVFNDQGETVTDGQLVPSLLASVFLGMAAAFLLYAYSFGDQVVPVIGGESALTLTISQCAAALIGGLGGSEIIKRLVAEKTRDNALKVKEGAETNPPQLTVQRYLI